MLDQRRKSSSYLPKDFASSAYKRKLHVFHRTEDLPLRRGAKLLPEVRLLHALKETTSQNQSEIPKDVPKKSKRITLPAILHKKKLTESALLYTVKSWKECKNSSTWEESYMKKKKIQVVLSNK